MGVEPCPYFHWWTLRVGPLHPSNSTNQNHTSSGGGVWLWHASGPQRRLQECVTRWHQNTEGTKSVNMAAAGMKCKTSLPKYSNSGCIFFVVAENILLILGINIGYVTGFFKLHYLMYK